MKKPGNVSKVPWLGELSPPKTTKVNLELWMKCPLSETTPRLDSCFSPLLDTKGCHGDPEGYAQRSKVALNSSIDAGDQRAQDLNVRKWNIVLVFLAVAIVVPILFSLMNMSFSSFVETCVSALSLNLLSNHIIYIRNRQFTGCSHLEIEKNNAASVTS